MYEIVITDSSGSLTLPALEVPLAINTIEGATDVQTLDYNIYTDFIALKRLITHTWAYLSEDDFNNLKGFYDRQFIFFEYPTISIPALSITDIVVRMNLNPQTIIDKCGTVDNVTVSFRESKQNP